MNRSLLCLSFFDVCVCYSGRFSHFSPGKPEFSRGSYGLEAIEFGGQLAGTDKVMGPSVGLVRMT